MALLGPNTLGFVNPGQRIALMPMQSGEPLTDGSVGVVSQSGNMAVQVMNMARSFDVDSACWPAPATRSASPSPT